MANPKTYRIPSFYNEIKKSVKALEVMVCSLARGERVFEEDDVLFVLLNIINEMNGNDKNPVWWKAWYPYSGRLLSLDSALKSIVKTHFIAKKPLPEVTMTDLASLDFNNINFSYTVNKESILMAIRRHQPKPVSLIEKEIDLSAITAKLFKTKKFRVKSGKHNNVNNLTENEHVEEAE